MPFPASPFNLGAKLQAGERVLLTGATGFVGSHLVELLAEGGRPIRALVRSSSDTRLLEAHGAEIVVGELDDGGALREALTGCDVVVHLAAVTHARRPEDYERVNAAGTRAIVEAAEGLSQGPRPGPRRLVYLSSLAAAGPCVAGRPVGARDVPRPLTAYGRSKLAGERACLEARGVSTVVLRAPAVYGPRDREFLRVFRLAVRGIVPVPGDARRPVQLIHAADLARALLAAADAETASGVYHVAERRCYPYGEVARLIGASVGREVRILPLPAPVVRFAGALSEGLSGMGGRSTLLNRDKARELLAAGWLCETDAAWRDLGFEAAIALPEGLEQTARWYRDQGWL